MCTYWNFLLGQDYGTVLSSDANGHDVGGGDSLKCILCATRWLAMFPTCPQLRIRLVMLSALQAELSEYEAYRLGTGVPDRRRW